MSQLPLTLANTPTETSQSKAVPFSFSTPVNELIRYGVDHSDPYVRALALAYEEVYAHLVEYRVDDMDRFLDQFDKDVRDYENTIEDMQDDYDELERELRDLKRELKAHKFRESESGQRWLSERVQADIIDLQGRLVELQETNSGYRTEIRRYQETVRELEKDLEKSRADYNYLKEKHNTFTILAT